MKKIIAFLLCLIMIMPLVGCGGGGLVDSEGNKVDDESKILDISMWNSGYGVEWVNKLAEEFKKKNPGVAVNIDAKSGNAGSGFFYDTILTGVNANPTDLYFAYGPSFLKYVTGENSKDKALEPLNDVVNFKNSGESKTIGEKMGKGLLDPMVYDNGTKDDKTDDIYYALSREVKGGTGIVYNSAEFDKYGLAVPRTTEELKNLVIDIQESTPYKGVDGAEVGVGNTKKAPFMHIPGYWTMVLETWWIQYAGTEKFDSFWDYSCVDINDMKKDEYFQPELKSALKALYDVISPEGVVYQGSNSMDFTLLQSRFIESNCALMYPCGPWLESEMLKAEGFDVNIMNNFKMMKTPVLSDVAKKLSVAKDLNLAPSDSVTGDLEEKLLELIDYVDGITEVKPSWATDEDVKLVNYARNIETGQFASATIAIPSYAKGKNIAKEFLKFMYSDEGLKIFADCQHTMLIAEFDNPEIKIDTSNWSEFSKSVVKKSEKAIYSGIKFTNPIRYRANTVELFEGTPEKDFTLDSKNDRKNVEQFLDVQWSKLMAKWDVIKSQAGI